MHPRSPFADRSLFRLGALHEAQDNLEKAVDAYNRLLEKYPNSLLTGDARSRLRALQRQLG
jgi:TolA-binding protein